MIYIQNSEETSIKVPKNILFSVNTYVFELKNEVTNENLSFNVTDSTDYNDYYTFSVDFTDVKDGEWRYMVKRGLLIVSEGLLIKGNRTIITKQHNVSNQIKEFNG